MRTRWLAGLSVVVFAGCTATAATQQPTSPAVTSLTSRTTVTSTNTASSTASRPASRPLAGVVIVVDPGHNGGNATHASTINRLVDAGFGQRKPCNTTGTATNRNYPEHAFTWDVAARLRADLQAMGATVVLTRPNDSGVGPCVNERAHIGNVEHASVVVSIHADGNLAPTARGFHVIVASRMYGGTAAQQASMKFATTVRDIFQRQTGMPRSTYTGKGTALSVRSDIAGLTMSYRPAVMIETGNMRNATDAALLTSAVWRAKAAAALASAVRTYLKA